MTETDEEIREKYRKIYKDMKPLSKDAFSNPTKDQKENLRKLEARDGKVVIKEYKDEEKPEQEIQKMESMDEWQTLVKEKYDNLKKVIESNLPHYGLQSSLF